MHSSPLLTSLTEFFEILLRTSGRGALMAVGVLAVQAALRRQLPARWRYSLWLAVLAALLLPSLPSPSINVAPYTETTVLRYAFPAPAVVEQDETLPPTNAAPVPVAPSRLSGWEIAALGWAAGAMILAAFWLSAHALLLSRFKRGAQATSEEIVAQVQECAEVVGLRRLPRILQAAAIESPAVTGFGRATLLLPADVEDRFTATELRFVLLHELAHLRRGDVLLNWLVTALLALHWFNPVLWFAAARLRMDRENACDATVLGLCAGDERSAYGHTLLKLHTVLAGCHRNPAFVGILERAGSLRQRIQHIATYRSGGAAWGIGAALLAMGWLLCTGVELVAQTVATSPVVAPEANLESRLLQRLSSSQQIEIETRVFAIDPSEGSITMGAFIVPHEILGESSEAANSWVLNSEQGKQFLEKLSQTKGVESISVPGIITKHSQRAVIEMIREFRYATDWSEPPGSAVPEPTNFETRNVGVSIEFEPTVALRSSDVDHAVIDLNVVPQLVYFGGMEDGKTPGGHAVQRPKFIDSRRAASSVSVFGGQHVLMVHTMDLPEGNPWEVQPNLKASEVKLRRRTILWLISPRLLNLNTAGSNIASELFKPRDWRLVDAPIEQWVAYFTEQSRALDPLKRGLNLAFGKPATEPRRVTMDLKATSLISALDLAAKAAGMRVQDQGTNTLLLTSDTSKDSNPR